MKLILKMIVPKSLKIRIHDFLRKIYYKPIIKDLRNKNNKKRIILIGTPEHGNLGDHLIAKGEMEFFNDYFNDYKIIEITGEHYRYQRELIVRLIQDTDIIVITGGGFLGSLWMIEEEMVRDIIDTFDANKIVIFPSTIYFENNNFGNRELEKSKRIYSKHKDLSICLRDEKSINVAKQLLGEDNSKKIIFTPDIALYFNKFVQETINREGIIFCLRDDKEKVLSNSEKEVLEKCIKSKGLTFKETSTVLNKRIKKEDRDTELSLILGEFSKSRLVITDRLHGMIIAAITGTPCIAMDNYSGKVQGVYTWLKHLNYIHFAKNVDEVSRYIDEYLNIMNQWYTNKEIMPYFINIIKALRNED